MFWQRWARSTWFINLLKTIIITWTSQRNFKEGEICLSWGVLVGCVDRRGNKNVPHHRSSVIVARVSFSSAFSGLPSVCLLYTLSCSNFWEVMSLTSELPKWFHHIHAFRKSHLQISMGQPPRAANWRRLPSEGRRWGALILWPFPCFFLRLFCAPSPDWEVSPSGAFWVLWPGSVTSVVCDHMTDCPNRTKTSWLFALNFLGVSLTMYESELIEN